MSLKLAKSSEGVSLQQSRQYPFSQASGPLLLPVRLLHCISQGLIRALGSWGGGRGTVDYRI